MTSTSTALGAVGSTPSLTVSIPQQKPPESSAGITTPTATAAVATAAGVSAVQSPSAVQDFVSPSSTKVTRTTGAASSSTALTDRHRGNLISLSLFPHPVSNFLSRL